MTNLPVIPDPDNMGTYSRKNSAAFPRTFVVPHTNLLFMTSIANYGCNFLSAVITANDGNFIILKNLSDLCSVRHWPCTLVGINAFPVRNKSEKRHLTTPVLDTANGYLLRLSAEYTTKLCSLSASSLVSWSDYRDSHDNQSYSGKTESCWTPVVLGGLITSSISWKEKRIVYVRYCSLLITTEKLP